MTHGASPLAAFHLIGDRSGLEPGAATGPELRPALYARYQELERLRFDYPVILARPAGDAPWAESLTDAIDRVLRKIAAPGSEGEALRRQVLGLEQAIRSRVSGGAGGALSSLWEHARRELLDLGKASGGAQNAALERNLQAARECLGLEGEVVACDPALPGRLLTRAWQEAERRKAERLIRRIARLRQKLSDILEVDDMNSPGARSAERLERALGSADRNVFDFDAMARLLRTAPLAEPIPRRRRARIQAALDILRGQQFVNAPDGSAEATVNGYRFRYEDGRQALAAFRERLPAMAELVKALSIAELESDNHYDEGRHDAFFEGFDEHRLGPGDVAQFPAYLLCLDAPDEDALTAVFGVLRAGLPFKVLVQPGDVLGRDGIDEGQLSLGLQAQQAARMAAGLDNVFVMQASAAMLYRLRDAVERGLSSDRPALFSVYAGAGYLDAAAATESRLFPSFVYDPAAGPGLAQRYSLDGNPQRDREWAAQRVEFETADRAYKSLETVFTPVDYAASDPRFANRFACVASDAWTAEMEPLARYLERPRARRGGRLPYVLLVDADGALQRAVVDEKLVDAAERCRDGWRSLQELGGIGNSHAEVALAEARQAWEQERRDWQAQAAGVEAASAPAATAVPAAVEPAPQAVAEPASEPSSDDPWIETVRCTSCNECTQLNDRMFGYDADKRAFIKDPDAGTYRQLVEAAESCQVAIIHPGKPRNPDEPGLEDLLRRAEPFL